MAGVLVRSLIQQRIVGVEGRAGSCTGHDRQNTCRRSVVEADRGVLSKVAVVVRKVQTISLPRASDALKLQLRLCPPKFVRESRFEPCQILRDAPRIAQGRGV